MDKVRIAMYFGAITFGVFFFIVVRITREFEVEYLFAVFLFSFIIGDLTMFILLEKVAKYSPARPNQLLFFVSGIILGGLSTTIEVLEFPRLGTTLLQAIFLLTTIPYFVICLFYFERRVGYRKTPSYLVYLAD